MEEGKGRMEGGEEGESVTSEGRTREGAGEA